MAKTDTISIPDAEETFWKEFKKEAMREGGASLLLRKMAHEWYNKHGKGNPTFKLEQFGVKGFFALPTMGDPQKAEALDEMQEEDFLILAKSVRARAHEIDACMKRRRLSYSWSWSL
jgi:hypothetical protein